MGGFVWAVFGEKICMAVLYGGFVWRFLVAVFGEEFYMAVLYGGFW